ncbi:MAG TPA: double-CXXCG motif protein [Myxococcus sp.]|nr:double-CXXCG motif protein [Myxococcus sp.]
MRFFEVSELPGGTPRAWSGTCHTERQWSLPGADCPGCGDTWSGLLAYPAVDVSGLQERHELEVAQPRPYAEYARLAALVRPLCPANALLEPGTSFGPLHGTARGQFGPVTVATPWLLLVREDVLEALRAAGVRGLVPVRPEFRKAPTPPVLELQLLPQGRLHPDCLPPRPPPCPVCGREEWWTPDRYWADAALLPTDLDVFRLTDSVTSLIVSEQFVDVALGFGRSDVVFRELPVEPGVEPLRLEPRA